MTQHENSSVCLVCGSGHLSIINHNIRNNYKLSICDECGMEFSQPRPSTAFLSNYYNNIPSVRFFKHTDKEALKDSAFIHDLFKENKAEKCSVLEIGCSTGYYLYGLKLRGYKVVGSELSLDAVRLGKEWYNLELYADEFPPEHFAGSFDAVIISHVIEHVPYPNSFLQQACKFLKMMVYYFWKLQM